MNSENAAHGSLETASEARAEIKKPPLYKVILHNDHYTTMEFVIYILMKYFRKLNQEAVQIMLDVHKKGAGIAGVYTREIAETKIQQVSDEARKSGYPLKLSMEKE